jgi:glucose/arabinose dehydrogenase
VFETTAGSDFASAQDITGRADVLGSVVRTTTVLVGAGSGGVDFPAGIAFGPDGNLYVSGHDSDNVLRYDPSTGTFLSTFVPTGSGGLDRPPEILFGPDGNLYVSSYNTDQVMRYDGATGAPLPAPGMTGAVFASGGGLDGPCGLAFQGGRLYVASEINNQVLRYDSSTGAFIDVFVSVGSGGLNGAHDLLFGPDGNLYVSSQFNNSVLRYNGSTGAFINAFVPCGSGGIAAPVGLSFGPDGNLYVSGRDSNSVMRYNSTTGAFLDAFVPGGAAGLSGPEGNVFGPDGSLYVTSGRNDMVMRTRVNDDYYKITLNAGQIVSLNSSTPGDAPGDFINNLDPVLQLYNGAQVLVGSDTALADGRSGQLGYTATVAGTYYVKVSRSGFTEGEYALSVVIGSPLQAADGAGTGAQDELLAQQQIEPQFVEAQARWQRAGLDAGQLATLKGIDIRIADLGGAFLGLASGHTIWLDDNAAGWGWFVDPTPHDDSEFTTAGDQGEQGKMDLLTTVMHEMGHVLGLDHNGEGVMLEALATGTRRTPPEAGKAPGLGSSLTNGEHRVGLAPGGRAEDRAQRGHRRGPRARRLLRRAALGNHRNGAHGPARPR